MTDMGRLRWRCRRGMRELDQLLLAYLERGYDTADQVERAVFERLLDLPDPELWGYFTQREHPAEPELGALIDRILAVART